MKKAKIGDIIEWTIPIDSCSILSGCNYKSEVIAINNKCHGVYTTYGCDLIPFEQAKIIK